MYLCICVFTYYLLNKFITFPFWGQPLNDLWNLRRGNSQARPEEVQRLSLSFSTSCLQLGGSGCYSPTGEVDDSRDK